MSELKFKLVKSEQEVTTLEQSVSFDQLYALRGDMFVVCPSVQKMTSYFVCNSGDPTGRSGDTIQVGGRKLREDGR